MTEAALMDKLMDKLRKVELLYDGATTPGERKAALDALNRIRRRLGFQPRIEVPDVEDPLVEYKFQPPDAWTRDLLMAILNRYNLVPFRKKHQRQKTILVKAPKALMEKEVLPAFQAMEKDLHKRFREAAEAMISLVRA